MKRKPAAALLAAVTLTGGLLFGVSQQAGPYTSEECKPGSGGLIPYPFCGPSPVLARVWLPQVVKK